MISAVFLSSNQTTDSRKMNLNARNWCEPFSDFGAGVTTAFINLSGFANAQRGARKGWRPTFASSEAASSGLTLPAPPRDLCPRLLTQPSQRRSVGPLLEVLPLRQNLNINSRFQFLIHAQKTLFLRATSVFCSQHPVSCGTHSYESLELILIGLRGIIRRNYTRKPNASK